MSQNMKSKIQRNVLSFLTMNDEKMLNEPLKLVEQRPPGCDAMISAPYTYTPTFSVDCIILTEAGGGQTSECMWLCRTKCSSVQRLDPNIRRFYSRRGFEELTQQTRTRFSPLLRKGKAVK